MKQDYKKACSKLKPLVTGDEAYTIDELCDKTGYKKSIVYYVIGTFKRWGLEYSIRTKTGIIKHINTNENRIQSEPVDIVIEVPVPLVNYTDLAIGCRIGMRGSFVTYRVVAIDTRLDYVKLQDPDNPNDICTASALMLKPIELSDNVLTSEIGEKIEHLKGQAFAYDSWIIDNHYGVTFDYATNVFYLCGLKVSFGVQYLHEIDYLLNVLKK